LQTYANLRHKNRPHKQHTIAIGLFVEFAHISEKFTDRASQSNKKFELTAKRSHHSSTNTTLKQFAVVTMDQFGGKLSFIYCCKASFHTLWWKNSIRFLFRIRKKGARRFVVTFISMLNSKTLNWKLLR